MTGSNGRPPSLRSRLLPRGLLPQSTVKSKHPYRDSLLIYAAFGAIVIALAITTGGSVLWGVVAGVGAFVLATGWTWRDLRRRERSEEE